MRIFIDSSVIISALLSPEGGSAKIIELCEAGIFDGYISGQVRNEILMVIERKIPEIKKVFLALLNTDSLSLLETVPAKFISNAEKWISDPNDVHILAAAKFLDVDCLITLDIRHFIKDTSVAKLSGLKILPPKDFLKSDLF